MPVQAPQSQAQPTLPLYILDFFQFLVPKNTTKKINNIVKMKKLRYTSSNFNYLNETINCPNQGNSSTPVLPLPVRLKVPRCKKKSHGKERLKKIVSRADSV